MPTDPLESIIYRELAKANAKPLIDIASPVLRELVNYGSNALVRCATSSDANPNEDLAILSLYRHVMEMTDGIEVLIVESCPMAAIPMLRSAFEALIFIDYLTESQSTYVPRSLAWLVDYIHQRIAMYERLDPSTDKGKDFQESIAKDVSVKTLPMPPSAKVSKARANLTSLLADPQFATINSYFEALAGPKKWFRLYDGPNTLRDLAHYVGRAAHYDFMYRYWSRVSHGQDFGPFITRDTTGKGTIRPIRDAAEMKTISNFAATNMLAATRALMAWFRPDEDMKPWYLRDVRSGYVKLYSMD